MGATVRGRERETEKQRENGRRNTHMKHNIKISFLVFMAEHDIYGNILQFNEQQFNWKKSI